MNTLGSIEKISFPIIGDEYFLAKVDTGAESSSIDCDEFYMKDDVLYCKILDLKKIFKFKKFSKTFVKSSNGEKNERYKVFLRVVVDGREIIGNFTLNDRKSMNYPILIGRDIISKGFIVDITKEINCKNCTWHWNIEPNDKNTHLCHKCGFDNLKHDFDFEALENWKKEINNKNYKNLEEVVRKTIRKIFKESAEKNFKIDYPYYKIEKLVDYYKEEFQDYMNKQGWDIFESDDPSLHDKYNSDSGYFWQIQVIDEPYGEVGFYDEEGNALIGITTDQEAIELARKTGLMVDDDGLVYGFKETSLLSEDMNHSDESIFNSITKNEIGGLDFSGDDYLKASVDISDYFIDAQGEKKPYRHMEVYRIDSKIDFSSKSLFDRVERKGIGTKMLSELISYCKQNNIPYIGSKSLNEKSFGLFKKFEDKGVLSPAEYGLHKKTILWKIN